MECAVVYLNTFATFKQWYIPCENEIQGQTVVMLNNVILTKVRVQSINDVSLPTRASNKLRGDAIWLYAVYAFNYTHIDILETFFKREELYQYLFILEGEV